MRNLTYEAQIEAAKLAVAAFPQLDPAHAHRLAGTCAGWALLALLANAAAKRPENTPEQVAAFYEAKEVLLRPAICMARDWWATPHSYGEAYGADTVVLIETDFARFAFHTRKDSGQLRHLLADAPSSDRGWGGLALQPFAAELVEGYLSGPLTAAEIIASVAPERVIE